MYKRIFLVSFSLVFLFISFANIIQKPGILRMFVEKIFPTPTPEKTEIKGIGVIGDSLSDEYRGEDDRGYEYAPTTLNWIEQLVKSRGLNFGLWGTWGDVRRTGFAYNWSRTSATTIAVLLNEQHTGLASQIRTGDVNIVVIFIGANDFFPFSVTYEAIYNGSMSDLERDEKLTETIMNVQTIIKTVQNTGNVKMMLVTIPDWNMSAAVQLTNQDSVGRQRVSRAIEFVNLKLAELAKKNNMAVVDANAFYRLQIADAPLGSIRIGSQDISLFIPGDEPHHAFLSDAVHPGTLLNGLFANYIINRMNEEYHTGIRPLTQQEILRNAGL